MEELLKEWTARMATLVIFAWIISRLPVVVHYNLGNFDENENES